MKRRAARLQLTMATVFAIAALAGAVDAFAAGEENAGAPSAAQTNATQGHANAVGQATSAWLSLQRSNAAAAPALPTPGAQASLAYERYLESFRTRIPASFGSALSGEGNAARGGYTAVGGAQPAGGN